MSCPSSVETEAVFNGNGAFQALYIIILIFVGISTIATWIFYTRVGINGIVLNVIYTVGFICCIIGIAANSWPCILIFTISLCVDVMGAVMMSILLFKEKVPKDLLEKFPFTEMINKIIFVGFASSQFIIIFILALILSEIFAKCD